MAQRDAAERRVYNLPGELVERIKAYQTLQGLTSETDAARRLLETGLQMRDTVRALLNQLRLKHKEEKDIRILVGNVLGAHVMVKSIAYDDWEIEFVLTNGDKGKITRHGITYEWEEFLNKWERYPPVPARVPAPTPSPAHPTVKRESEKEEKPAPGHDLDDEIPF